VATSPLDYLTVGPRELNITFKSRRKENCSTNLTIYVTDTQK